MGCGIVSAQIRSGNKGSFWRQLVLDHHIGYRVVVICIVISDRIGNVAPGGYRIRTIGFGQVQRIKTYFAGGNGETRRVIADPPYILQQGKRTIIGAQVITVRTCGAVDIAGVIIYSQPEDADPGSQENTICGPGLLIVLV